MGEIEDPTDLLLSLQFLNVCHLVLHSSHLQDVTHLIHRMMNHMKDITVSESFTLFEASTLFVFHPLKKKFFLYISEPNFKPDFKQFICY